LDSRRPRRRFAERLEPRWLLASDAYVEFNLASNQPGAALVTDPSLGYAWGIAASPGASGAFSLSNSVAGRSNSYSGDAGGSPFSQNADQTVYVPLATGQVYNGNANEFIVHSLNPPPGGEAPIAGGPAEFIYASLDGTIYGFNASVGQLAAPAVSVTGASFTGLTLANNGAADQLYATDYAGGKIDVFDAGFQPVATSGSFTDPNLPAGYKPFNIQALGGELYVSYAASLLVPLAANIGGPLPPIPAPGGVIDVFDVNGGFVGRIASGSPLDRPWGMALAPQSFGPFAGDLLVANHGDGKINVFDPTPGASGTPLATLGGADGNPFVVDGLWGLAFGNGDHAGDADSLYFTAGSLPDLYWPLASAAGDPSIASSLPVPAIWHGLFGTIQVAGTDPLAAIGTNATARAGEEFSGALAAFGSADLPSPMAGPAASYIATIDWGDGSTTTGSMATTGNGGYLVVGSHTYAAAGADDYQVTIRDASGNSVTAAGVVQVTSAPLLAKALPVVSHGLSIDNASLATFVDAGGADPLANYSATIDWGDGTTSYGTISSAIAATDASAAGGLFTVAGSHAYGSTGDYTFTVTIRDVDGSQATVQGTAHLVQATLVAHALPVVSHGLSLDKATVATFFDTGGADPLANYSATIDWGDGSTSAGTISSAIAPAGASAAGGLFTVAGSHTYASIGDYKFTVTISDIDGSQAAVQGTAHVVQAPLLASGVPVVVTTGLSVNGAIVAAFADAGGGDAPTNYGATIDWGDGSTSSATVAGSGNSFIVVGSHEYASAGIYQLKIAITDQDGSTARVATHAFIDSPVASFVATAFQDVLHRSPDDSGLDFWNQQIASGLPAAQFASDLTHSGEFYATNVIAPGYQTYLGRAADAAGLAFWTGQMQQGMTDQQLEANFIASPEFYAHAGGADSAWVNAMYQAVLGRQADGSGLSYWTGQLSAGMSRSSVAIGFAASQEREAQIIQDDYFAYLGRTASPAEVNYWVAQFEHGATNEDILSGFVGSSEYVKLHS
jgi:uncharacterized protein (TIGR03118 family)